VTPDEEQRIRAEERQLIKAQVIDGQLADIFRRLGEANSLKTTMVTKLDFKAFEKRHEDRLQEFMHQARSAFVLRREQDDKRQLEIDRQREDSAAWHDKVWVRLGIATGAVVGLATVIQAAVFLYLTLSGRH
jgi:uncharacterized protein YaiL (DUF2058 family)